MLKERNVDAARSQDCGVGQGRDFVTEIGSTDDGPCNPSVVESLRTTDAHEGNADGGDGCPRTASHDTDHGADDAGRH